jgi:Na+/melibiose symporter-like transporter
MLFFIGIPILGWVASLVAMRYYELDGKRMEEIQADIHERNLKARAKTA